MNRKIGVLLSYVFMIFEVLSTLLLTPFIIRTLGQAEYGVYKLAAAVNAYLLLLDLGIGNAITRYIAKYRVSGERDTEEKFLGVATIFYLIIGLLTILIGIVLVIVFPSAFAKGLSTEEAFLGQKLLAISMTNSAITLGTAAYTNVIIAYEKFFISKGGAIAQIIIRIILTYCALLLGLGSVGIVIVNLLMTILYRGFNVLYVLLKLNLRPKFKNIDFLFVKEIIVYSSFIFLQMIATQLNSTLDQVLIGSLVESSAVILAVYSVGTQLVQYFQSIGSSFNGVLMPGVVKIVENGASAKELTNEMVRIGRLVFMVLILIWSGFLVNGKDFIVLWAGSKNENSYFVAIILMSVYLFILTESIGSQILWAMNKHKEQSVMKLIVILVNIVLTILLIKWNPLLGATIGTFISLLVGDVGVMNLIFRKKLHINLLNYYRGLFKGIVPSALFTTIVGCISCHFINGGWMSLAINLLIMVVTYSILMYFYGMNSYEKNLICGMINKITIK